ncbi:hypothetical protein [Pseudomonas phage D6]|nr:hypothetical protein [Pseudomonas phage D6]
MSNDIEVLLSKIPDRNELIKRGTAHEVKQILELVVKEFEGEQGYEPFLKAQDNQNSWKWYVELPFHVSEYVQHAVRDHLAQKEFNIVHFNDHNAFDSGFTRMSLTILKGDKA